MTYPPASASDPTISVSFAPNRFVIHADTGASATITRPLGNMHRPAVNTLRPNP